MIKNVKTTIFPEDFSVEIFVPQEIGDEMIEENTSAVTIKPIGWKYAKSIEGF